MRPPHLLPPISSAKAGWLLVFSSTSSLVNQLDHHSTATMILCPSAATQSCSAASMLNPLWDDGFGIDWDRHPKEPYTLCGEPLQSCINYTLNARAGTMEEPPDWRNTMVKPPESAQIKTRDQCSANACLRGFHLDPERLERFTRTSNRFSAADAADILNPILEILQLRRTKASVVKGYRGERVDISKLFKPVHSMTMEVK